MMKEQKDSHCLTIRFSPNRIAIDITAIDAMAVYKGMIDGIDEIAFHIISITRKEHS
jgi:hypothetical protein